MINESESEFDCEDDGKRKFKGKKAQKKSKIFINKILNVGHRMKVFGALNLFNHDAKVFHFSSQSEQR